MAEQLNERGFFLMTLEHMLMLVVLGIGAVLWYVWLRSMTGRSK
jgi:hypothetical protein